MAEIAIRLLGDFAVSIDGVPVDRGQWARRHAAALVKVLALADGHRLHREQVLDLIWPDDTVDQALPKLHKAAHYARRALGVQGAVALRGDHVALAPGESVAVDAARFETAARTALATRSAAAARAALAAYGGELLPEDRYDDWASAPRDRLRLLQLDLLRLDQQWEAVLALEPSEEQAHVELMRLHAAAGDRHAALRQFERLDRALRSELGLAPGPAAVALRDRLLSSGIAAPARQAELVGRDPQLAAAHQAIDDVSAGRSRTLLVSGPPGAGKSTFLGAVSNAARAAGLRTGHGGAAQVEGTWPFAPVIDALADLSRRHPGLLGGLPEPHRRELDAALAGRELTWEGGSSHQRLFVAATELVRLAASSGGVLLTIDDLHDADDASLRLVHFIARSTQGERVLLVLSLRPMDATTLEETRRSLLDRHGATEISLPPLAAGDVARLVERYVADPPAELVEQIAAASRGIPFAVNELARRAATAPSWVSAVDAFIVAGIPAATRQALQRVAVLGVNFDTDEFVALSGQPEDAAFGQLDAALAAAIVEPTDRGYRFRHELLREALLGDVPPHRRRAIHRDAAQRLIERDASPARIGHHLMEAGAAGEAVPYLLRAANTEASIGAYRDALAIVDSIRSHATGEHRQAALVLRGDLLNAIGDPQATSAYREALGGAGPGEVRLLRARIARAAVMSGDLDTARAAIDGLQPLGDEADSDILLARGNLAFFSSDLEMAEAAAAEAQRLILAGRRDWKVLDLVALQGMLAHLSGNWFDRIRSELRRTRDNPEVANAIFDGHLCAAEYMLYGPTPYAEVIAVGADLKRTAERSGALRAAAFAAALIGEAALLSGDLDLAEAELGEARDLHHDLGSTGGEAHSLQRLAELWLARGEREMAEELLHRAVRLARSSMISRHLLQRIFGTMITSAVDPVHARAAVDRAESILGWDDACRFCAVMVAVPATIACARVGDLEHAHRHLEVAERSAGLWEGTAWEAALGEARAAVALASGDRDEAVARMRDAVEIFDRAGQPLDAQRCRAELSRL